LRSVLVEKYHIKDEEAVSFANFLLPMLEYHPYRRVTAQAALFSPWLSMPPRFDYKLSDPEAKKLFEKL